MSEEKLGVLSPETADVLVEFCEKFGRGTHGVSTKSMITAIARLKDKQGSELSGLHHSGADRPIIQLIDLLHPKLVDLCQNEPESKLPNGLTVKDLKDRYLPAFRTYIQECEQCFGDDFLAKAVGEKLAVMITAALNKVLGAALKEHVLDLFPKEEVKGGAWAGRVGGESKAPIVLG